MSEREAEGEVDEQRDGSGEPDPEPKPEPVPAREPERDDAHVEDLPDGIGCTEIWEHLSEQREKDA